MAKLLYVTCNLKPTEISRSLSVGKEFLDEYLRQNPDDEVHFLDLYRDNIQRIDADVLAGWGRMRAGESFASLTTDEQRKVGRIWKHADQFIAADKYVFVTPMFPEGLLKNQGRKGLHIHSNGGFHYGKEEDHSVPYLKSIMGFMGIENFEAIVVEGVDAIPEQAEHFVGSAIEKARSAAARF